MCAVCAGMGLHGVQGPFITSMKWNEDNDSRIHVHKAIMVLLLIFLLGKESGRCFFACFQLPQQLQELS